MTRIRDDRQDEGGKVQSVDRELLKEKVTAGRLKLLIGTDAASTEAFQELLGGGRVGEFSDRAMGLRFRLRAKTPLLFLSAADAPSIIDTRVDHD